VRAAVTNLPDPPLLEDALVICLLLLDQEPDRYERAAVRWLGRLQAEVRLRLPGTLGEHLGSGARSTRPPPSLHPRE
jgi:hypothetical protein